MVYGFAAAGSVVTRLIKPLQGYLHNRGIRSAIYMDDGQVVASSAEKTKKDMETTLKVFQQAGWNIQWTKTATEPSQEVKYLGMYICLTTMEYKAPTDKENEVIKLAQEVLAEQKKTVHTNTRKLAKVKSKLVALKVSHGLVTQAGAVQDGSRGDSERMGRKRPAGTAGGSRAELDLRQLKGFQRQRHQE